MKSDHPIGMEGPCKITTEDRDGNPIEVTCVVSGLPAHLCHGGSTDDKKEEGRRIFLGKGEVILSPVCTCGATAQGRARHGHEPGCALWKEAEMAKAKAEQANAERVDGLTEDETYALLSLPAAEFEARVSSSPLPRPRRRVNDHLEDAADKLNNLAIPLLTAAKLQKATTDYLAAIDTGLKAWLEEGWVDPDPRRDDVYAAVLTSTAVKEARVKLRAASDEYPSEADLNEIGARIAKIANTLRPIS